MAAMMMPAKAAECEDFGNDFQKLPQLTLQKYVPAPSPARKQRRARRQNLWENLMFFAAMAAVSLFCLGGLTRAFVRDATNSDRVVLSSAAVLPVTVHSGDTLWTYAQKYGASDTYILDRVETIARTNHLSSDTALVAGQHLLIPVTNPVILARIESRQRLARR